VQRLSRSVKRRRCAYFVYRFLVINSHAPNPVAMAKQVFGTLGSINTDRAPIAMPAANSESCRVVYNCAH
jgi:hypothetical protein